MIFLLKHFHTVFGFRLNLRWKHNEEHFLNNSQGGKLMFPFFPPIFKHIVTKRCHDLIKKWPMSKAKLSRFLKPEELLIKTNLKVTRKSNCQEAKCKSVRDELRNRQVNCQSTSPKNLVFFHKLYHVVMTTFFWTCRKRPLVESECFLSP